MLSNTLKLEEKEEILDREYRIPVTERMKEEMNLMCNLSDLVEERAMEKGRQEGMEKGRQEGMEKGRQEGMEKGRLDMLIQLVREHILSVGDAASRIDMPESEFKKLV